MNEFIQADFEIEHQILEISLKIYFTSLITSVDQDHIERSSI